MNRLLPSPSKGSLLRLLASVGLAVILWAWVTTLRDPETTRSFSNVPVSSESLAESLVVVDETIETQVRITGPESVVDSIPAGQVRAILDIEEIDSPGMYTVDVTVQAPGDVWRTQSDPSTVGITVESAVAQEFDVEVVVQDLDASSLRTVDVAPESEQVVVRGPSSAIESIASIELPLETSGGSRTYQTTLVPEAVDADGEPVEGVRIEPASINATVAVAARGKSVAVLVSTEGSASPGYEVLDRTANPASVIVEGPDDVVDQLIAVSAEPIDISGASSSVSSTVPIIDLPDGVTVIQPSSGEVDVLIQVGQRGVRQALTGLEVTVANLGPGLVGSVNPANITIEVVAPEEVLSTLTVESFQVVIDASGLGVGAYPIEPMVIVPAQVQWISATPAVVELTISEEGSG